MLSGGGAKGAYQIGCLKALRAAGLSDVRAIAGTSVGAVNAVFFAADRLDVAEATWRRVRLADVIGFSARRLLRSPLWLLAALRSEFSPLKLFRLSDLVAHPGRPHRWSYPLGCLALALAALSWRALPGAAGAVATGMGVAFITLALLAALHRATRRILLDPLLSTADPLARLVGGALSSEDVERVRARQRPVFGTLSCFCPEVPASALWGGWVPHYVRLDRLDRTALLRVLLDGMAVPGVFAAGTVHGRYALDGAWTDNIPAAPILFDTESEVDLLVVVHVKNRVRYGRRSHSLWGLVLFMLRRLGFSPGRGREGLVDWAATRWPPYRQSSLAHVARHDGEPAMQRPLIVSVMPSQRIGGLLTGALWFSPAKAARLIALGEKDMDATLAGLAAGRADVALSVGRSSGRPVLSAVHHGLDGAALGSTAD